MSDQDIVSSVYDGGGAKGITWGDVAGQFVDGTITRIRQVQDKDFNTEEPAVWSDGSPKMVVILTLQTTLEDDDEDDGRRDVWLRGNQHTAFRDALQDAFRPLKRKPTDSDIIGARFYLKLTKREPSSKKGGAMRKIFQAKIWPKSVTTDVFEEGQTQAQQPAQPPATQAQQQQAKPAAQPTSVTANGEEIPF
jgi:hypothetical protein